MPVITFGNDFTSCPGVVLDAGNPGATYLWNTGNAGQMEIVTAGGIYSVVVTDTNGCSSNDSISITINPNPVVTLGPDTTGCVSVTISPNMNGTFLWNTGGTGQTETIIASGIYSVTVTDTNGCSSNDSISVIINPNPPITLGPDTAGCTSVTIGSNISGTFLWSNNTTASWLTATTSGFYWVMVTDSNGCFASDSILVLINGLPNVSLAVTTTGICVDDADVTLTGTPAGGTYSGTSVTGGLFDPSIGAGTHDVYYSYTDSNGCTAMDTLSLL